MEFAFLTYNPNETEAPYLYQVQGINMIIVCCVSISDVMQLTLSSFETVYPGFLEQHAANDLFVFSASFNPLEEWILQERQGPSIFPPSNLVIPHSHKPTMLLRTLAPLHFNNHHYLWSIHHPTDFHG